MKKVMLFLAIVTVMGMQTTALYASDYGDQQVNFGDVRQYPSNPYVFGNRDWYTYNKHRSTDEASALSGVHRHLADEYVAKRAQEKAERARFGELPILEYSAALVAENAREVAAEKAAKMKAAWEREAERSAEIMELVATGALVPMEQDSDVAKKAPRKKMWTRVYDFFEGTPEQRAEKARIKARARQEEERARMQDEQETRNERARHFQREEDHRRATGAPYRPQDHYNNTRDVWNQYPYGRPTSTESPFGRGGK